MSPIGKSKTNFDSPLSHSERKDNPMYFYNKNNSPTINQSQLWKLIKKEQILGKQGMTTMGCLCSFGNVLL